MSDTYQVYLKYITGIFWVYLRYIICISQLYFEKLNTIFYTYIEFSFFALLIYLYYTCNYVINKIKHLLFPFYRYFQSGSSCFLL